MSKEIKVLKYIVAVVMLLTATQLHAQFNGGNVASPYSIFGIGDLRNSGTATSRSMGGGGYANRDRFSYNMLNPASNSVSPAQTFLFSLGGEGINSYLASKDPLTGQKFSTSQNAANLGYLSVRFPIARGLGFGFSMSPYSSVGYSIRTVDESKDVTENIGGVNHEYSGKGDIAQYKAGFGWQIFKGFSVGANFIYYKGSLVHDITVITNPYVSNNSYATIYKNEDIRISRPSFEVGLQYHLSLSESSGLVLGAVYQPRIKSDLDIAYLTTSILPASGVTDTLYNTMAPNPFAFPQKIAGGITYLSKKMKISLDYSNEDFKKSFYGQMSETDVQYKARNTYTFGFEYTPNIIDIRSYAKKISYRFGVRYSDSYYRYKGTNGEFNDINEFAISAGVGMPFNHALFSSVNVGVEYSLRGTQKFGMMQTNYVSFFVDFNLFAQRWFQRFKNH